MKIKFWILIIIGAVVLSLIVGGIVGSQLFPKTKIIEVTPEGRYCYNNDQSIYSSNNLNYIPSGNWDASECLKINSGMSRCYIISICPNCVTNKVICGCQK